MTFLLDRDALAADLDLLSADPLELTVEQRAEAFRALARHRAWADAREAVFITAATACDDAAALGATGTAQLLQESGAISGHAARRRVRAADALSELPAVMGALETGTNSTETPASSK